MHKTTLVTLAAVAAFATAAPSGHADMGRFCQPRPLTAAEKEASGQIAEKLHKTLPQAPTGWKVRDDKSDAASGACQAQAPGKMVNQPVQLTLYRTYVLAASERTPAQLLGEQIAIMQAQEKDATAAAQTAHARGDSTVEKAQLQRAEDARGLVKSFEQQLSEMPPEQRAAAAEARARAAKERAATATTSPPPAAPDNNDQARIQELERQIAALQRKDKEAIAAYQAARRGGDGAAQKQASEASREHRLAMRPLQQELTQLRRGQHQSREAASAASTRSAREHAEAARANRSTASVSIYTNLPQLSARGGKPVSIAGVPLALRDSLGRTYLLFGKWRNDAAGWPTAALDESAPSVRVQNVGVRIDGNEATTEQLLKALDLAALKAAIK